MTTLWFEIRSNKETVFMFQGVASILGRSIYELNDWL